MVSYLQSNNLFLKVIVQWLAAISGSIVWTPHEGAGIPRIKKGGQNYGAGTCLLKGGTWHFSYLISRGLSFLHLKITLPFAKLCHAFEEKVFFSATIIL